MIYSYINQEGRLNTWSKSSRRIFRNWLGPLTIIIILIGSQTADAATLQQLNQKKTTLQGQIDAKNQEAADKKKQADAQAQIRKQLQTVINRLDSDINTTNQKIDRTQSQITDTENAITEQEVKIRQKEAEIVRKKADFSESVAESYIAQGNGSALFTLLSQDRISDAFDQLADLDNLASKLMSDAEALDRERQDLLAAKAQLEQKEQDLQGQQQQLAAYEEALNNQKDQKAVAADQAKQAQAALNSQANDALKVGADLKKQFAAVAAEAEAMARAASRKAASGVTRGSAPPSSYGLVWPMDGAITTYFGGRTPYQNFHTGLDVAGPAGDPIHAAASGTVTLSTKMCCSDASDTVDGSYGYGNYIMISHDNGLVTLYGHMLRMTVVPGDHVERGQVIGYRGGSRGMTGAGWSTGAHLHFEVRDAQGPDDPMKYLP